MTHSVAGVSEQPPTRLARNLGLGDAVVIGLGSMIGAGVFAAVGPAADAAGTGLLLGLGDRRGGRVLQRDVVGGARRRLPEVRRHLRLRARAPRRRSGATSPGGASWSGRPRAARPWRSPSAPTPTPSGAPASPSRPCSSLTAVNSRRAQDRRAHTSDRRDRARRARGRRRRRPRSADRPRARTSATSASAASVGVLQSAGLLFFAFAGYARIATLGEEVRDPARTIPRAIPRRARDHPRRLRRRRLRRAPRRRTRGARRARRHRSTTAVEAGSLDWLRPAVRVGGTIAALGVLLSLIAGVSRTMFAMAADGELPRWLDAVHPAHKVPHRAEVAVGVPRRQRSPRSPTSAARSASARSPCSPTTRSPTPQRGRCHARSDAGRVRSPPPGSSDADCSP